MLNTCIASETLQGYISNSMWLLTYGTLGLSRHLGM